MTSVIYFLNSWKVCLWKACGPWFHFRCVRAHSGFSTWLTAQWVESYVEFWLWIRRVGPASLYKARSFFLLLPCSVSLGDRRPALPPWPPPLCWPTFALSTTKNHGPATAVQVCPSWNMIYNILNCQTKRQTTKRSQQCFHVVNINNLM